MATIKEASMSKLIIAFLLLATFSLMFSGCSVEFESLPNLETEELVYNMKVATQWPKRGNTSIDVEYAFRLVA